MTAPTALERILPRRIDNSYRGHRLGLWILGAVVFMKTGIALGTIVNGRAAAQSADGIPLDTFGPGAAEALITLFALWGLSQLVISAFAILALTRYRSMVPWMFATLLSEHVVRRLIVFVRPVATNGTPPGLYVNLALIVLMIAGLVLSLRPESRTR